MLPALALAILGSPTQGAPSAWIYEMMGTPGQQLRCLKLLEDRESTAGPEEKELLPQFKGWMYSFMGECHEAQKLFDSISEPISLETPYQVSQLAESVRLDAVDEIVRLIANHRIVIVSEAHHYPQSRTIFLELLPRLRKLGFKYFAAETFSSDEPNPFENAPTSKTGFYTCEPVFGSEVRLARTLGFKLVAYEMKNRLTGPRTGIHRDQVQAERLKSAIFDQDPNAKVLIQVGYSHVHEETSRSGPTWMAEYLKHSTGLDPLTVDAATMLEHASELHNPALRRRAIAKGLGQPSVFRRRDGKFFVGEDARGAVDMQIFWPDTKYVEGRPDWLLALEARKLVAVPSGLIPVEAARYMVEACRAADPANAIPYDRVFVVPGRPVPKLALPPGSFQLRVYDETGTVRSSGSFHNPERSPISKGAVSPKSTLLSLVKYCTPS